MAITHPTAVRNGLADHVVDQLDTGTGDASGDMIITTSVPATLVTIALQNPSFGAAASGTATMNGSPSGTATASGTAAEFECRNRANTTKFSGAVATSGSDLNISNTTIAINDKVQITSFTYSAPN